MSRKFANGRIGYLEIPATDIGRSAAFYRDVFGWRLRKSGDGATTFDDPAREMSGTWVTNRPASSGPGMLVYILVDSVEATVEAVVANGGEIVQPIGVDPPPAISARFRDPGGNVLAVYQKPGLDPSERKDLDMVAAQYARYGRSPQRRPGNGDDLIDEFLRLACLTNCSSCQHVDLGEETDDPRRQAQARRLLAENPQLTSTTIYTAAAVGDLAAARSLLATDESLANQEGGPHRWPPLLYLAFSRLNSTAAGHSTLEVARLLLAHGADPNAGYLPAYRAPIPVTALSGAFRGRDWVNQPPHQHSLPLARLLLDAGADPNDEQALRNACGYPFDDAGLQLLLEHGLGRPSDGPWLARLDPRLRDPPTPAWLVQRELFSAAQWNLPNRVRLLLRRCAAAGIDINVSLAPDDPGRTAHNLAVLCGNTEIVDLLTQAGAKAAPLDPTIQLVAACLREDRPAVHRLLAADPSLAERAVSATWRREPLPTAVALGRLEAVALLVSLGFPVNDRRESPLHFAALAGNLDMVKLLVELGADPTAETIDDSPTASTTPDGDRTPLGYARYNHQYEVAAYLTRLTSAGPNPPANSAT